MKFKKILSVSAGSILLFSLGGVLAVSAQGYVPLVSLPGVTEAGTAVNMSSYLSGMIKLLIALATGFAVLMLIVGGTQYVASGVLPDQKSDAKNRMLGAIGGLALVLVSYLILNSINPKLVQFHLMLPPVGVLPSSVAPVTVVPKATSTIPTATGCSNCVVLSSVVPQKAPGAGCKSPGPCQVSSSTNGKLEGLTQTLKDKKVDWQVSEAWPPTRPHSAACQNPGPSAGTCVDASLLSPRTATNINAFTSAASQSSLRAVYEVPNSGRRQELVDAGVPSGNVITVAGITGEHFSVYNN